MAITQLPAANYTVSEAIPLSFVNCQASSSAADTTSCGTNAIHRNAYTGVAYDIPVGVHGGAFPYGFELTSAPSGMTIGENYSASDPSDSYGRITWATPTAGNHVITVQVTDQAGTVITSTWTLVVGTANWVFVDGSAGTGGDGSIGNPYDSLDDVLTGHAGELCYIRGSTLTLTTNFQLNTGTPVALIGYPSETADIAMTDGWFVISTLDDGAFKNLTLRHLNMTGATQDRKCISQINVQDRNSFTDLTITNFEYGADGTNNGAVFSSLGAINNNQFIHNWDVQASNMSTVIQVFKHRNSLIQKINVSNTNFNSGSASSNGGAIRLKDGWSDTTIRLCELWDNNTWSSVRSCIGVAGQDGPSIDATDICYNTLYQPSTANQNGCLRIYTQNQSGSITNTHVYRNSLRADVGEDAEWSNGLFTGMTHTYEKNVVENGTLRDDGDEAGWYNLDNVEGTTVVFDASMKLTGAARTTYFGTVGAEVFVPIYATPQLPASRYIPAKQAAHLVHPRPDSETASWAKHRKHYPGIKYEVPVGVSFGSWPFYYDLTTAPAGATIGENVVEVDGRLVPGDDYGVVTWDNPTVGSHTFQVTVSFQDGATPLFIYWTLEVTTAGTIFVDAVNGLDTNDGVLDVDGGTGPLKTIDGWFKADSTDRTYTGYQVCYLAGTYVVGTSDPETTGNMRMNYLNKPLVHYAKNVEAVTWDFQNTMLMGLSSPQPGTGVNAGEYNFHDWFLGRITCSGGPTGDNKRRWYVLGDSESSFPYDGTEGGCRNTWFKSPQIDWPSTGAVNDNAGICFGPDTGSGTPARYYFYVTQCPITNITSTQTSPVNFNGWWLGQSAYFLAEHNVITNTNFGRGPYSAKSSEYRSCYRNIDMSAAPDQGFVPDTVGSYAIGYGGGCELSYSKINYTGTKTVDTAVEWGHHFEPFNDSLYPYHEKNWQFRNSISKAPSTNGECFRSDSWPTEVIQDIWCSKGDGIYGGAPSNAQLDGDWKLYTVADDPFDSSMNLTDTEFAGTHGAEVLLESALATASISTSGNLVVEFSEVVSDGGGGIDDFTIAGRTLSNFVLDASGNTITADVSPVIEAADADPAVFYTQPTGGLQTVGAVDVASFNVSATNNSTQDNTAPVLSSTTGTTTGTTTATGTVDTDEGNGDIYWLVDTSDSTNQATVLGTGATQAVSSTGTKIVNAVGLAASTVYYFHFVHKDAAGNDSAVVHSPLFTTDSSAAPTLLDAAINSSGSNLALTFSEAVQEAGSEAAVTLSNGVTLAAPSGTGTNKLTFGLSPYVQAGETITVSFAGGANVIEQNGGGVDVEAFAGFAVTNISTATPPAIIGTPSINSTGTLLTFFFDDLLDNLTTPVDAPFSLVGGAYTFTSSSLVGTGASFVISPAVQQGDVLTLSFVEAANTFTSVTSALAVESFSGVAITNNSTVVTVPPVFTLAPAVSKTTISGHSIRQTIDKAGTVYGVMVASEENPPSPEQIKAGTDGQNAAPVSATSVAATAGNPCVLTFSGGAKNTAYYYYIIAEDTVPNLQTSPVRVTATTENLLFNGSGGGGLPAAGPKKKVKMKWEESKRKGKK